MKSIVKERMLKNDETTSEDLHKLLLSRISVKPCRRNGHQYMIEFEVIDQDVPSILGLPTTVEINLVQHVNTIATADAKDLSTKGSDHYNDVFDGLGCISDV